MNSSGQNDFLASEYFSLYQLLSELNRVVDKHLSDSLEITFNQFLILNVINRASDVNQQKLSKWLNLSKSLISQIIQKMVEQGWVQRDVNRMNRRENQLEITARGQRILEQGNRIVDQIKVEVFQSISESDAEMFHGLVNQLLDKGISKINN